MQKVDADPEKLHLIEWIAVIENLNVEEKVRLESKNMSSIENMFQLALLQLQDEYLG